jgi:Fe-S oxidoreductase
VNLALLKAELRHARHERHGLPLAARVFSAVDVLGALGCVVPTISNAALNSRAMRWLAARLLGVDASRPLPLYASERFDTWIGRRVSCRADVANPAQHRGKVILWDDTFVRYHEPHIGQAAVAVLEAAGFEVVVPRGRQCCGRPAFSQGNLERAARLGRHNLELLATFEPAAPIVFLEPSCWSMFTEDYRELKLAGADEIGRRCFLFEQFIEALLSREPDALTFRAAPETIAIHAHCHAKALLNPAFLLRLAQRLPGRTVELLDTGCCGMAGAFGMMQAKQQLSRAVAAPLTDRIARQPPGTIVVASGTSCRHQIAHLSPAQPQHMAEVLAGALEVGRSFNKMV